MTMVSYMTSQFSVLQNIDFFIRLLVACLCGAAIGFERSRRFKGAGLRTHIIVCCAAALMMIVSKYGFADLTDVNGVMYNGTRGADSARVAAQVVSGISFIGAGVIFKHGNSVRGLTTAAGIWATAGIGLAIGAGMYPIGIFSTVLIAGVQFLMHRYTFAGDAMTLSRLRFTIRPTENFHEQFEVFLQKHHAYLVESKVTYDLDGFASYEIAVRAPGDVMMHELDAYLQSITIVRSVDSAVC